MPPSLALCAIALTVLVRLASAPALSSASTQGAWPRETAKYSAVNLCCGDAAARHTHTRVSGGGRRAGGA